MTEPSNKSAAPLEIRCLSKRYGSVWGAEDVSFDVACGEVFGYLGPNGSGKTTTIRCIMGLLRPTGGEVRVLGERVEPGRATCHSRIGYLPGDFRIWPDIRARRVLSVLSSLGGRDERVAERRDELAKRLELDLNRPVGDLSKGNRQKIGVINAFQHNPELLILDEPTIGLDPLVRQVVMDLIREAAGEGATVLLSSHDLGEVAAVCGRAAILRAGRLVELAPITRIVQQGEHRLKLWFPAGVEVPSSVPGDLPLVRIVHRDPESLEVAYQGSPDGLLQWISRFRVQRMATPETSLEEAFLKYYQGSSERAGGEGAGGESNGNKTGGTS